MKLRIFYFIVLIFTLSACSVEPEAIEYGTDACHYCMMNIVDNQHAAELVTMKGKAFKYDAIECMLNDLKELDKTQIALLLTNTFDAPGELLDVGRVIYLMSENMPSPMGANLTAFKDHNIAKLKRKEKGGVLLKWIELTKKYNIH